MGIQIPVFDSIRDVYDWTGLSAECLIYEEISQKSSL